MRLLDLRECASGRERGLLHGRQYAGEIKTLVELRIFLACKISGFDRKGLFRVAEAHLPLLKDFDEELYDELVAAGNVPDAVTFTALIDACGRANLLDQAFALFGR